MKKYNIPKIIHYCWFGRGEKPDIILKYMETWKKKLPDYKIIEWNEDNFDINSNTYVKEAYKEKKWAFVTDYVRLFVLYNNGGIYLDTDVEILKSLDEFLVHKAFSGFESEKEIPTGIMGSCKGNKWIKQLLKYYDNKSFYKENGKLDLTTNVKSITDISIKLGANLNNSYQIFSDGVAIYPKEYFAPKSHLSGKINITRNTYCIHHFAGSWTDENPNIKKIRMIIIKFIGEKNYIGLSNIKYKIRKLITFGVNS